MRSSAPLGDDFSEAGALRTAVFIVIANIAANRTLENNSISSLEKS